MTDHQENHCSSKNNSNEAEPYFIFTESSKLKRYVKSLTPKSKTFYRIKEVYSILLDEIRESRLYDSSNPYIILCYKNPDFRDALSTEAIHINELKDIITKEMFKIEDTEKVELYIKNRKASKKAKNNSQILEKYLTEQSLTNLKSFFAPTEDFEKDQKFACRPKFLKVLKSLPYFDHVNQDHFLWEEIRSHLQTYMLINCVKFFSKGHKNIAVVKDSLLGDALQVNAFHKDQTKYLVLQQLIPVQINRN